MNSAFNTVRSSNIKAGTKTVIEETYDLRGLNLVDPDQIMPKGQTPFEHDCRMYAKESDDSQVAIRTRKGSTRFTAAHGETLQDENVTANTGDISFSTTKTASQPYVAGATGILTRLDLELKKISGAGGGRGVARIEFYADNAGHPGQLLGASSVAGSDIGTAYGFLPAYLIDGPNVVSGQTYHIVAYIQDNGSGEYYWGQSASTGNILITSMDDGLSWTSSGVTGRYKTYLATDASVRGFTRRYPSNNVNRTIYAAGNSIISIADDGTETVIDTLTGTDTPVRFDFINDLTLYADGQGNPRQWDGTTVSDIPNAPTAATMVKIWQNRAFFLVNKTEFIFSNLLDITTYDSTDFFYVPSPKSSDPVTGARVFLDNFLIFTHNTKHTIIGSDITTFTRKEAVGTRGAVCDEAIAVSDNACYFMSDDGNIYAWNGAKDTLMSRNMEPLFSSIPDKTKVRLHLYKNQLRVYFASPTSDFNDQMALLDLDSGEWFRDTGRPVCGSMAWEQDQNQLIEFSSRAGWLFQGEQTFSDLGKAIDFEYRSRYNIYSSGTSKKRIKNFTPVVRTANVDYTMQIGKDMDYADKPDMRDFIVAGGGAKWGDFVWGDGTKFGKNKIVEKHSGMSGRGKHIQYRFKKSGVETPVEIYGWIAQVKVGKPR